MLGITQKNYEVRCLSEVFEVLVGLFPKSTTAVTMQDSEVSILVQDPVSKLSLTLALTNFKDTGVTISCFQNDAGGSENSFIEHVDTFFIHTKTREAVKAVAYKAKT